MHTDQNGKIRGGSSDLQFFLLLSPLFYAFLVALGAAKEGIYYRILGLRITSFVEFSEVILQAMDNVIWWAITITISLTTYYLVLAFGKWAIAGIILLMLSLAIIYRPDSWRLFLLTCTFIGFTITFLLALKSIEKCLTKVSPKGISRRSIIAFFFIALISSFTLAPTAYDAFQIKNDRKTPGKILIELKDGGNIQSNDTLLFVGITKNYFHLYHRVNKSPIIIQKEYAKKVTFSP